jgi:small subunit ribosomal protein S17
MATKKSDDGVPAVKKTVAKQTSTKKTATRKPAAKKPVAEKGAEVVTGRSAKKASSARTKAKVERKAPDKVPGRKERRGVVVSHAMDKTIVVRIDVSQKHQRYGRVVRRSTKLHAHDERNAAGAGDLVRIVETRPLSATKRWRLLEILEKAK